MAQEVDKSQSGDCMEARESMWGAGEGQGHPLQKLEIPKRRPSGERGNEEEGLALRQGPLGL